MPNNPGDRGQALVFDGRLAGEDQRRSAIGDRAGVGCCDCTILLEGRSQARDLFDVGLVRLLIIGDGDFTFTALDGNRDDFFSQ